MHGRLLEMATERCGSAAEPRAFFILRQGILLNRFRGLGSVKRTWGQDLCCPIGPRVASGSGFMTVGLRISRMGKSALPTVPLMGWPMAAWTTFDSIRRV